MEQTMWSDERIDDLAQKVDAGFDRVDRDLRELRDGQRDLHSLVIQLWGSTLIGFMAMIATVLLKG